MASAAEPFSISASTDSNLIGLHTSSLDGWWADRSPPGLATHALSVGPPRSSSSPEGGIVQGRNDRIPVGEVQGEHLRFLRVRPFQL